MWLCRCRSLHNPMRSPTAPALRLVLVALVAALPALAADADRSELDARIARDGVVRIVVALRDASPVTARGAARATALAALRRRQDAVLRTLPRGSFTVRRRYAHLNGFAG